MSAVAWLHDSDVPVFTIGGSVLTRLPARLLTAALLVSLSAGVSLSPVSAQPRRTDHRVVPPGVAARQARASASLSHATSLFPEFRSRSAAPGAGRDATMVLRDLSRRAGDLPTATSGPPRLGSWLGPPTARAPAASPSRSTPLALRWGPTAGTTSGVHWVEDGSADAVADDGDVSTYPAWVTTTLATMEHVYGEEVGRLGYRPPVSDAAAGGNDKIDVYLADIGNDGLYGYCASETAGATTRTASGYCVLDNDFAAAQFPDHTPTDNLHVTAAHEFFHLVQFGYDYDEDPWFMEGTAAWMEDELYDSVNDNRQYLQQSPLTYPYVPLDYANYSTDPAVYYGAYGSWIFWKYLSESTGPGRSDNPAIVRDVWQRATSTYSVDALKRVLAARGTTFAKAFATFSTWTRDPARYFSEGRAYPVAPLDHRYSLTKAHRSTGWRSDYALNHLSNSFVRFSPGSTLTGTWRLRVSVDMPNTSRGSAARVVLHKRSGAVAIYPLSLSSAGVGTRVLAFSRSTISYAELDLIDASTRYTCSQGTTVSCGGTASDDGLVSKFTATAVR